MLKWFGEQLKERTGDGDITFKEVCGMVVKYSQIPLYRLLPITDSSLCPWGKKALINTFCLNSTRLIWNNNTRDSFYGSLEQCLY